MKLLHLDIETLPGQAYFFQLKTDYITIDKIIEPVKTGCWAAKWHGKKNIIYRGLNENTHKEMITKMWELLDEADAVCHYNGKRFDIKHLNREFKKLGLKPPSPFKQIDLLNVVKANFNLLSNKLDYVVQYFNLGKKVPHVGFELWKACVDGCEVSWRKMKKYNVQDTKLLEILYNFMLPWITNHPNMGLYTDEAKPTCTNCGSTKVVKNGVEKTKTQIYQRYRCKCCGTNLRGRFTMVSKEKRNNVLTQG